MDTGGVRFIDYKTAREAASEWSLSVRRVIMFCNGGRIPGAIRKGNMWLIPINAGKPPDGRVNNRRQPKKEAPASEPQH